MSRRYEVLVTAAALAFGLASTVLAADDRVTSNIVRVAGGDSRTGSKAGKTVIVASDQKDDPKLRTSRRPWPAPTGHRQPRVKDIPENLRLSEFEPEQRWLDKELDRKLEICRGC